MWKSITKRDLGAELLAFFITLLCVIFLHWGVSDLIWGLWTCSLCVGYAYILTIIVRTFIQAPVKDRPATLIGCLFLLAFFSFHFGMFHFVHSVFLNEFFTLVETGHGPPNPFVIFFTAFGAYWPLVLTTFISRWSDFASPLPEPDAKKDKSALKGDSTQGAQPNPNIMKPYVNVVRMHILIFIFAGLHAASIAHLAVYPVLAFYFAPWGKLLKQRADRNSENVSEL
jgi:hypothetical protein